MAILWQPKSVLGYKQNGELVSENLANHLFSNPKIFAEKILKQEAVSASITIPVTDLDTDGTTVLTKAVTIPFYMSDNFSLGSLKNDWNPLVNLDFANSFTQLLNIVNSFNGGANVTMQSELMSLKTWGGSSFDGFSVNCLFVATNRRINPTRIIRTLASSALPTKLYGDESSLVGKSAATAKNMITGVVDWVNDKLQEQKIINSTTFKTAVGKVAGGVNAGIKDMGMVAPLHYGIAIDEADKEADYKKALGPVPGTTLTLQIGEYFRATELLVQSISAITFSKEIIAENMFNSQADRRQGDLYDPTTTETNHSFPLWGSCTITFVPCSMMTKEKFMGYFLDPYESNSSALKNVFSTEGLRDLAKSAAKNALNLPTI